jgi:hypothetical protein
MRALSILVVLALAVSPAAAQPRLKAPTAPVAPVAPVAPAPLLANGGFAAFRGLTPGFSGLAPAGDARPVCRSRCAQDRYVCGEQEHCTERWAQCVAACAPTRGR